MPIVSEKTVTPDFADAERVIQFCKDKSKSGLFQVIRNFPAVGRLLNPRRDDLNAVSNGSCPIQVNFVPNDLLYYIRFKNELPDDFQITSLTDCYRLNLVSDQKGSFHTAYISQPLGLVWSYRVENEREEFLPFNITFYGKCICITSYLRATWCENRTLVLFFISVFGLSLQFSR